MLAVSPAAADSSREVFWTVSRNSSILLLHFFFFFFGGGGGGGGISYLTGLSVESILLKALVWLL